MRDATPSRSGEPGASLMLIVLAALAVTVIGAAMTWLVLDPVIGIDDANITQVYARNLAAGHGYVYNPGGETVEGSTSLLWTVINTGAFALTGAPERLLAIICLGMTWGTIAASMALAADLSPGRGPAAALVAGLAFLAFPSAFGWMVWSLMDVTLWVMLITLTILVLHRIEAWGAGSGRLAALAVLAALLPITRPEGLVLTTALAGFCLLRGRRVGLVSGLILGLAGAAAFAAVTAWRLQVFGYPFPNTYYAKSSTDLVGQVIRGVEYVLSYLQAPQNVFFVTLFAVAGAVLAGRGPAPARVLFWLVLYVIAGGALLYTALGGDHFGAHRFFVYFLPLGQPLIAAALTGLVQAAAPPRVWPALVMTLAAVAIGLANMVAFLRTTSDLRVEFAIAEEGRALGSALNGLPGSPVIGLIAAGGVRMTYAGEVRDLMGLNWTAVAHAPDDAVIAPITNHTGFNTEVFWQQPPEAIPRFPVPGGCPETWQPLEGFLDTVTDGITRTKAFREAYDLYCLDSGAIYVSRDWAAGQDLPGELLPR